MDLTNYEQHDVDDLVAEDGYSLETHKGIYTTDGYVLTLHRLLPQKPSNAPKHPVLLVHGMLGCTGHFLVHGSKDSLPYMLHDSGFDVWMGNVRGVIYSREHVSHNHQKDYKYWHFSMHEMGIYDLPAMIDYILKVNGSSQLDYIGFSQGCVIFFIMCSEKPEYAKKISLHVALSPLIFVKGAVHPWLPMVSKVEKQLQFLTKTLNWCGLRFGLLRRYEHIITSNFACQYLIKLILHCTFGTRFYKIKNEHIGLLMRFFQGLNFHVLFHAMQMFNNSKFIQYDYGSEKNMEVYGTKDVRDYMVENVSCPVVMYYSDQDWFMPGENVTLLANQLPNVVGVHKVDSNDFSHFDFLIAEEAIEKLYKPIVQEMNNFHFENIQCQND